MKTLSYEPACMHACRCNTSVWVIMFVSTSCFHDAGSQEGDKHLLDGLDPHTSSRHCMARNVIIGSIPFQMLAYWTMRWLQPDPMHTLGGLMHTMWSLMIGNSLTPSLAAYEAGQNDRYVPDVAKVVFPKCLDSMRNFVESQGSSVIDGASSKLATLLHVV